MFSASIRYVLAYALILCVCGCYNATPIDDSETDSDIDTDTDTDSDTDTDTDTDTTSIDHCKSYSGTIEGFVLEGFECEGSDICCFLEF